MQLGSASEMFVGHRVLSNFKFWNAQFRERIYSCQINGNYGMWKEYNIPSAYECLWILVTQIAPKFDMYMLYIMYINAVTWHQSCGFEVGFM